MNLNRAWLVEFSKVGDALRLPFALILRRAQDLGKSKCRPRWWQGFHRQAQEGLVARPCVHAAARVRLGSLGLGVLLAAQLMACGTPPPPPQLYQLRSAPPVAVQPLAAAPTVQLLWPVAVPELLERDAILVAQGQAGVQALPGHRWAEPLRDAVPRLLRQDLALLLGDSRVWVAPLPAGVVVQRLLRVELLALQADASRSSVQLQARWTLSDPAGRTAALTRVESLSVAVGGGDVDAVVVAHRQALWQLAERLALAVAQSP